MKIERNDLEERILNILGEINKSRKSLNELNIKLAETSVPFGIVESINSNHDVIKELELPVVIGLAIALYDYTGNADLHTDALFGKREIRDALDILKTPQSDKIYLPFSFGDVIKVKYDSYITTISIRDLVKMYDSQLIIYDYESQRGANFKMNSSGGIVKTPIVNKASVKRISKKMAENEYLEDMIVLNVFSAEVDPVTYQDEYKTLTINEGSIISILDGFHRLQGAVAALQLNPNADLVEILSIRTYDDQTAQKFFGQINTINVLKKERRKELAQEKLSDVVVLNLQRKSDIGKQIASGVSVSELAGELTTFDILSFAIDKAYKLERQFDVLETSDYLIKFFAYLVGYFPNDFTSKAKYSTKQFKMRHPLMFIGYIVLSKVMLDKKIDLKEMRDILSKINFDDVKLMSLLNTKGVSGNKSTRNNIFNYFDSLFRGVK